MSVQMAHKRHEPEDHKDTVNGLVYKKAKMGEYTDFALECDGVEIPVHKVIVCSQIQAFAAACAGGFKEGCSGIYRIEKFPQFLNQNPVLPPSLSPSAATTAAVTTAAVAADLSKNLVAHIHMAEMADYYHVLGLKELVHKKVDETLRLPWFPEGFADAVNMAFKIANDDVLRERLAATVTDHLDDFIGTDNRINLFTHDASFRVLRILNGKMKQSVRRARESQRRTKESLELQTGLAQQLRSERELANGYHLVVTHYQQGSTVEVTSTCMKCRAVATKTYHPGGFNITCNCRAALNR